MERGTEKNVQSAQESTSEPCNSFSQQRNTCSKTFKKSGILKRYPQHRPSFQHIKNCERKEMQSSTATSAQNSTVRDSSSPTAAEENLEIPGFYYDKVKKKYFKILPYQNKSNSSILTKESIKKTETEIERQKNLTILRKSETTGMTIKQGGRKICPSNMTRQKKLLTTAKSFNIFVYSSMQGCMDPFNMKMNVSKSIAATLRPAVSCKIFPSPANNLEKIRHLQIMCVTKCDENKFVWLLTSKKLMQRIQTVSLESVDKNEKGQMEIDLKVVGKMILRRNVTSMCSVQVNNKQQVMWTTTCLAHKSPSVLSLADLNSNVFSRCTDIEIGYRAIWCSAFNHTACLFSVGTEKTGLLLDVVNQKIVCKLGTGGSDVLSQTFKQDGNLLLSGTRKGNVLCHDVRRSSSHPALQVDHESSVYHLQFTSDENYLLAADFLNNIKKWDLRQRKVVVQYPGHCNTHSFQIPFHTNEDAGILYAAGEDCYSRIWDLNSGQLLRSIPPPHPADITTIPALHYSSHVGKWSQRPGLVLGMLDEVHFYSL